MISLATALLLIQKHVAVPPITTAPSRENHAINFCVKRVFINRQYQFIEARYQFMGSSSHKDSIILEFRNCISSMLDSD